MSFFYPPVPLLRNFLYIPLISLITYCRLLINLENFQVTELKPMCYKLVSSSDQGTAIHGYSLHDVPCNITNSFSTTVTAHRLLIYSLSNDLLINRQPGGPIILNFQNKDAITAPS
jgi:hypothetical protein